MQWRRDEASAIPLRLEAHFTCAVQCEVAAQLGALGSYPSQMHEQRLAVQREGARAVAIQTVAGQAEAATVEAADLVATGGVQLQQPG